MRPKEHCWDCRKRRLVCDSVYPACTRCVKRGDLCPGYGAKPLTWIKKRSLNGKQKDGQALAAIARTGMMIKDRGSSKNNILDGLGVHLQEAFNTPHAPLEIAFETQTIIGAIEYCKSACYGTFSVFTG